MPNNFRQGDPFSVSLISGIEKFYAPEGYVTNFDFLSKIFFVSQCRTFFVGEPFSVSLLSGTAKVWMRGGGGIKNFRRKVFVSQCRTIPYW